MTRAEFVDYLRRWGQALDVRLQAVGALAGLPFALDEALRVVDAMRALGQPAPGTDEVRAWYRNGTVELSTQIPAAIQAYASLNDLCEADLVSLDEGQLLLFAVRCANWAALARSQWHSRRQEVLWACS
jgi:hypothetical protein